MLLRNVDQLLPQEEGAVTAACPGHRKGLCVSKPRAPGLRVGARPRGVLFPTARFSSRCRHMASTRLVFRGARR